MRYLVSLLALLWALANIYVAYLFLTLSVVEKEVRKGPQQQASLLFGGLVVGIAALLLVWQAVSLARTRTPVS